MVGSLRPVHAGKQFPVEWFGGHGVQRDRVEPVRIVVGHHATDDRVRLFDQPAYSFVAEICAIILSSGVGGAPLSVCPRIVAFVADANE